VIVNGDSTIRPDSRIHFVAKVSGPDQRVQWDVQESGGGSIDVDGLYTAPGSVGTYHIVARSLADPDASATSAVSVTSSGVIVEVDPLIGKLPPNSFRQFTAQIQSRSDGVTWSVETVGESSDPGVIDQSGKYMSPADEGIFVVRATDENDPDVETRVPILVDSEFDAVTVAVSPNQAWLQVGTTRQFTARVGGSDDARVIWSVQEQNGGTIDQTGLYTAPPGEGIFHVVAVNEADSTAEGVATVTVQSSSVTVTISPNPADVPRNEMQQFTVTVQGTPNVNVDWSVTEAGGGTIDTNGLYTAPQQTGVYHVVAVSQADATATDEAVVNVFANVQVSVDPTTATTGFGQTVQFTVNVTGALDPAVDWSVLEVAGGTVNASGLYTAPGVAGVYHVVAASREDPTKTAQAEVTVAGSQAVESIVYVLNETIHRANIGGTGSTTLATESRSWNPVINPGGTRIAWHHEENSGAEDELWILDGNGANKQFVAHIDNAAIEQPAWSPDGSKLAFVALRVSSDPTLGRGEIYIVDVGGTGLTRLTFSTVLNLMPTWSPDGSRIAYINSGGLYIMNADGTGAVQVPIAHEPFPLGNPNVEGGSIDWSPNGTLIGLTVTNATGQYGILIVETDGTTVHELLFDDRTKRGFRFSPDGTRFLTAVRDHPNKGVWTMDLDGTNAQLIGIHIDSRMPDWGIVNVVP
jgi:Tol biopolymer transport system component